MDYKRVLKLHFENGYSGRTIAKNTGEGQRTAINEFLKRFKECEELSWPLSEEVTNEYMSKEPFRLCGVRYDGIEGVSL